MPPEVVNREGYSYGADFYTLGCLLYELMVGLPPHYSQDSNEIVERILTAEITYPDTLGPELVELLSRLLQRDPSNRLKSFAEIKRFRWLRNVDWESVRSKSVRAPIQINLYENNIHDEFMEVDVSELNARNQ